MLVTSFALTLLILSTPAASSAVCKTFHRRFSNKHVEEAPLSRSVQKAPPLLRAGSQRRMGKSSRGTSKTMCSFMAACAGGSRRTLKRSTATFSAMAGATRAT